MVDVHISALRQAHGRALLSDSLTSAHLEVHFAVLLVAWMRRVLLAVRARFGLALIVFNSLVDDRANVVEVVDITTTTTTTILQLNIIMDNRLTCALGAHQREVLVLLARRAHRDDLADTVGEEKKTLR